MALFPRAYLSRSSNIIMIGGSKHVRKYVQKKKKGLKRCIIQYPLSNQIFLSLSFVCLSPLNLSKFVYAHSGLITIVIIGLTINHYTNRCRLKNLRLGCFSINRKENK